jgi:hypothetical protein
MWACVHFAVVLQAGTTTVGDAVRVGWLVVVWFEYGS